MSGPGPEMRLPPQPGEVINRAEPLEFTWNGRPVRGYAGDTIVSALAAAGERLFSRSLKYHRPRGLLTASFHDPGCVVQVGDEPNVRGAHRLAADGMVVTSQNTWPSLRLDAKSVNQLAGRFLTAGFYYKTFMRPRFAWPAYESVLQRFVNGGRVSPDTSPATPAATRCTFPPTGPGPRRSSTRSRASKRSPRPAEPSPPSRRRQAKPQHDPGCRKAPGPSPPTSDRRPQRRPARRPRHSPDNNVTNPPTSQHHVTVTDESRLVGVEFNEDAVRV